MTAPDPTVHVHVHLAMTGSFPLRVADLLFTDDAVVIPEYGYLTPLFGIARGGAGKASDRARQRYHEGGVPALLEMAEQTHTVPYDSLERVRIYDSRLGRPKVAVDPAGEPPYAYRVHAEVDVDAMTDALRSLGRRRGFDVDRATGLGYAPRNSLRRFLAGR